MERAFEVLSGEEPDADLASLAGQLGRFLFFAGQSDLALQRIETALELAEALGAAEIFSDALNTKAIIYAGRGRRLEALALLPYALQVALENDKPSASLRAYFNLGDLLCHLDRYEEASDCGPRGACVGASRRKPAAGVDVPGPGLPAVRPRRLGRAPVDDRRDPEGALVGGAAVMAGNPVRRDGRRLQGKTGRGRSPLRPLCGDGVVCRPPGAGGLPPGSSGPPPHGGGSRRRPRGGRAGIRRARDDGVHAGVLEAGLRHGGVGRPRTRRRGPGGGAALGRRSSAAGQLAAVPAGALRTLPRARLRPPSRSRRGRAPLQASDRPLPRARAGLLPRHDAARVRRVARRPGATRGGGAAACRGAGDLRAARGQALDRAVHRAAGTEVPA